MGSVLLTNNTTASAVAANGTIPLGSAIHGYGKAIRLSGNTIALKDAGYYSVVVTSTIAPTAATAFNLLMKVDGTTITSTTVTPTGAAAATNAALNWVIRKGSCQCSEMVVSFALDSAATVNGFTVEVVKL